MKRILVVLVLVLVTQYASAAEFLYKAQDGSYVFKCEVHSHWKVSVKFHRHHLDIKGGANQSKHYPNDRKNEYAPKNRKKSAFSVAKYACKESTDYMYYFTDWRVTKSY